MPKPGRGIDNGLDESVVVTGSVKHGLTAVATIEDVIPHPAKASGREK